MKFSDEIECPRCEGEGKYEVNLGYGIGPERLEEATRNEVCESCGGRGKVTLDDIIHDDALVEFSGGPAEVLAMVKAAIDGVAA